MSTCKRDELHRLGGRRSHLSARPKLQPRRSLRTLLLSDYHRFRWRRNRTICGPVTFDIDGNGVAEDLTWLAEGTGDLILALDRNNNGIIDDGQELFGSGTPPRNGFTAAHGFSAIEELDAQAYGGNGDGFLNAADRDFHRLLLWNDRNMNAVSESWEISKASSEGLI